MSPIKPSIFSILLEVFRMGLQYELFSREEILTVVHSIEDADAPTDALAEISNSYDETWLLGYLVKNVTSSVGGLPIRVMLGLSYQKFIEHEIRTEKFTAIFGTFQYATFDLQDDLIGEVFNYSKTYSGAELAGILAGRWPILSIYREFRLSNYNQWFEIDRRIDKVMQAERAKQKIRDQLYFKTRNKKIATIKVNQKIAVVVLSLFMIFIVVVNYQLIMHMRPVSIFKFEISELTILQVDVAGAILLLRVCYEIVKKRRKRARG